MKKIACGLLMSIVASSSLYATHVRTLNVRHHEDEGQLVERKVLLNLVPSHKHALKKKHYDELIKKEEERKIVRSAQKKEIGKLKSTKLQALPSVVDFRNNIMAINDQGEIGSCTAHAAQAFVDLELRSHGISNPPAISRLFQYASSRVEDGAQPTLNAPVSSKVFSKELADDSGATIASAVKSLLDFGAVPETLYPYKITKFKQTPDAYLFYLAQLYLNAFPASAALVSQDAASIKKKLSGGKSVIIGINCYESIMSDSAANTGFVQMPKEGEESQGGHAVLIVGFDDRPTVSGKTNPFYQHFILRNSWSANWGDKGYFYLPYDFITNEEHTSELWSFVNTADVSKSKAEISKSVRKAFKDAVASTHEPLSEKYARQKAKIHDLKEKNKELTDQLRALQQQIG
ncbi:MAG: C1 family peptidase [Alphaproteobacteria bacterium]|nr:C1 family peptidase [Alphaproteobacteria bacterium]